MEENFIDQQYICQNVYDICKHSPLLISVASQLFDFKHFVQKYQEEHKDMQYEDLIENYEQLDKYKDLIADQVKNLNFNTQYVTFNIINIPAQPEINYILQSNLSQNIEFGHNEFLKAFIQANNIEKSQSEDESVHNLIRIIMDEGCIQNGHLQSLFDALVQLQYLQTYFRKYFSQEEIRIDIQFIGNQDIFMDQFNSMQSQKVNINEYLSNFYKIQYRNPQIPIRANKLGYDVFNVKDIYDIPSLYKENNPDNPINLAEMQRQDCLIKFLILQHYIQTKKRVSQDIFNVLNQDIGQYLKNISIQYQNGKIVEIKQ